MVEGNEKVKSVKGQTKTHSSLTHFLQLDVSVSKEVKNNLLWLGVCQPK